MKKNIIVAIDKNNAIGKDNHLLFHLKDDLKNFRKLTENNVVIMGRKTYESIGKPLSNRVNIVVSRNSKFKTLEDAIKYAEQNYNDKELFFIGGRQIYKEVLDNGYADTIYLTIINEKVENADTWFPSIDYDKEWKIVETTSYKDEKTNIEFNICKVVRTH